MIESMDGKTVEGPRAIQRRGVISIEFFEFFSCRSNA